MTLPVSYLQANYYNIFNSDSPRRVADQKDKTSSGFEKEDKETDKIKLALSEIGQLVSDCNKYNCITCAKKVAAYLTHKSIHVRQMAADALVLVIRLALTYLASETNPSLRREISSGLQSISHELRGSLNNSLTGQNILSLVHELLRNIDTGDSLGKTNEDKAGVGESFALGEISRLFASCDKHNCISHAKAVLKYLGHESKMVRELACEALVFFLTFAIDVLENEESPSMKGELLGGLVDILKEITQLMSTGIIPQNIVTKLKKVIRNTQLAILQEKIKELKRGNSDQFICPELQEAARNLTGNITADEFVTYTRQIKQNLLGNIALDQFASGLTQSKKNLTGNISFDQFVSSMGQSVVNLSR